MPVQLYVAGLQDDISDRQLEDAFKEYGTVTRTSIVMDKDTGVSRGFGFVHFESEDEANAATLALDRKAVFGGNKKITVKVAQNQDTTPQPTNANGTLQGGDLSASGDADKAKLTTVDKRRPKPRVTEELLCGKTGIKRLFKSMEGVKMRGKGHEGSDVRFIMNMYRKWHKQIVPAISFPDFLYQLEQTGKKRVVQIELEQIRKEKFPQYAVAYFEGADGEHVDRLEDEEDGDYEIGAEGGNDEATRVEESPSKRAKTSPDPASDSEEDDGGQLALGLGSKWSARNEGMQGGSSDSAIPGDSSRGDAQSTSRGGSTSGVDPDNQIGGPVNGSENAYGDGDDDEEAMEALLEMEASMRQQGAGAPPVQATSPSSIPKDPAEQSAASAERSAAQPLVSAGHIAADRGVGAGDDESDQDGDEEAMRALLEMEYQQQHTNEQEKD